ncbi:CCHC-type zinc finger, nucleic acid binding protein a [Elysia marginata]|uniref:CCHC-type zinc finger, nucleic acid binding protein a n=1 Tax=Elysia marginata TaxID=1093978 RepID=A0AAV4ISX2_9GAST|nr:CCHC-type zinc finger, nucleic acid binding protein a [Elysia marginata]
MGVVRRVRSDNGGEFVSQDFEALLIQNKIKHEKSSPYSPHQNGTVERAWRTLFEMSRCLLLHSCLDKSMWTYALKAAAYIRNRFFNSRLSWTSLEAFTGLKPNILNMHVFGTECYAYIQNAKKLDSRAEKGTFVGYDTGSPAYLVYFPDDNGNKIKRVRCVKFSKENIAPKLPTEKGAEPSELEKDLEENSLYERAERIRSTPHIAQEEAQLPVGGGQCSQRRKSRPKYLDDYYVGDEIDNLTGENDHINVTMHYFYRMADIQSNYHEAMTSKDANK